MDQPALEDALAFLAVADAGSFTAAATRLKLAKSNVSRRVTRLEEQLGVRLLERTTRRLRLTDIGGVYRERLQVAVAQLTAAHEAVRSLHDRPRGHLRFTAPGDMGSMLGPLFAEFTARYPEVTVDVELTQRKVDLVAEGFDVALRAGSMPDSSMVARRVGVFSNPLMASPEYLARRGRPTSIEELAEHDFVLFRGRRQLALVGPEGRVTVAIRGRLSCNDVEFARGATIAGAGIGFTGGGASSDLECLEVVLPEYRGPGTPLQLVFPSGRFLTARVRALSDFLTTRLREELASSLFD